MDSAILELIDLQRNGAKVLLPPDLGMTNIIVSEEGQDGDNSPNPDDNHDSPSRGVLIDFIDLVELGGTVIWPRGWDLKKAKDRVLNLC